MTIDAARRGAVLAITLAIISAIITSCGAASTSTVTPSTVTPSTVTPSTVTPSTVAVPVETRETPETLPLHRPASEVPSAPAGPVEPLRPVEADQVRALPATVPSADGRDVTVDDASRILPLWGNLAEIVFSLGLADQVVGRDTSATFVEAEGLPVVTRGHDVSAESVLSLRPTVVLAQTDTGPPEALEQIRAAGVPILVVDTPSSVDDAFARIELLATALGVPDAGDRLAARTAEEIDQVRRSVPPVADPPRVAFIYLRGTAGVYLLGGPGSGADSMIAAAGGVDAGTEHGLDQAFTPLTSEALVAIAPDAILVTTSGLQSVGGIDGLVGIPGIAQTPAGRDRRVVAVEDGLLYSFGARTALAIAEIVEQLHAGAP